MEKICQCHSIIIGLRALETLNSIEIIQLRMLTATLNGNPRATIISCYSPTNVSEETELVTSYDELSSLVSSIPKYNMLVIGGDTNAQIEKNRNNKYSLHNTKNRNAQHLTDFMIDKINMPQYKLPKKGRENYGPTRTRTIVKHR